MRRCVSIVVVIMVGCGGAGSGTPSRAEVCADLCARYVGCGIQRPACESECTADRLFRDDFYPLLVECIDASCSNIGEACFVMVRDDLSVLPAETAFVADCEAHETMCGVPFTPDLCHAEDVRFFSTAYIETDLQGCLDLACGAVKACLEEKILDSF